MTDRCYHLVEKIEGSDESEVACYGGDVREVYIALDRRAAALTADGYVWSPQESYPWSKALEPRRALYVLSVPAHMMDIRTIATLGTEGKPVERPETKP